MLRIKPRHLVCTLAIVVGLLPACSQSSDPAPSVAAETGAPAAAAASNAPPKMPATSAMTAIPEWVQNAVQADSLVCYADKVNDVGGAGEAEQRTIRIGEGFSLMGWAVDKSVPASAPQPPVFVVLTSQDATAQRYVFPATRHERPDVSAAAEFATVKPQMAGVLLNGSLAGVKPGAYQLQYVLGEGGQAKLCDLGAPWKVLFAE